MELFTDASGSGFDGFYQGQWFADSWQPSQLAPPFTSFIWREMYPIAVACHIWGAHWRQKKICLNCDNSAVCMAWESGSCRHGGVMALIRKTLKVATIHNFCLLICHIPGTDNAIADALSHGQFAHFHSLAPSAEPLPCSLSDLDLG